MSSQRRNSERGDFSSLGCTDVNAGMFPESGVPTGIGPSDASDPTGISAATPSAQQQQQQVEFSISRWGEIISAEIMERKEVELYRKLNTVSEEQRQTERRREHKWREMHRDWEKWTTKEKDHLISRIKKGIPESFRGVIWPLLSGSKQRQEENPGLYDQLWRTPCADEHTIMLDITRTLPNHVLFCRRDWNVDTNYGSSNTAQRRSTALAAMSPPSPSRSTLTEDDSSDTNSSLQSNTGPVTNNSNEASMEREEKEVPVTSTTQERQDTPDQKLAQECDSNDSAASSVEQLQSQEPEAKDTVLSMATESEVETGSGQPQAEAVSDDKGGSALVVNSNPRKSTTSITVDPDAATETPRGCRDSNSNEVPATPMTGSNSQVAAGTPASGINTLGSSRGREALMRVVRAYANLDPEVGYCQGISFIAATCLLYLTEEEAFWLLETLMRSPKFNLRGLFLPRFPLVQRFISLLEGLLHKYEPKILEKLRQSNFMFLMLCPQWFICLFTYNFPLPIAARIWDLLFCAARFGPSTESVILSVPFSLIRHYKKKILAASPEHVVPLLCKQMLIDPDNVGSPDLFIKRVLESHVKDSTIAKLSAQQQHQ